MQSKPKKILVVGAGNPLRRDDGVGPYIINRIRKMDHGHKKQHHTVKYIDVGTDGLVLFDMMQHATHTLLVDAVHMNTSPGTIKIFKPEDAKINIYDDSLSTHTLGLATLIHLLEQFKVATSLKIIGIQPVDITLGEGLTPLIQTKVNDLLHIVAFEINQLINS
jgi:hydrogenase maturation protease